MPISDKQLAALLVLHSLPEAAAADTPLRYETTIQNVLYRAMSELDRLQARRHLSRETRS